MGKQKNSVNNRVRGLKPFRKGQSGNPNGRPKGQRDYATIYKEALIKLADKNGTTLEALEEEMLQVAFAKARKGDFNFYRDTLDRLHGRPLTKTDITTNGKELPTPIISLENVRRDNSIKEDSETEQED